MTNCHVYEHNNDTMTQIEYEKGIEDGKVYAKLCNANKEIPEWLAKRKKIVIHNFANGIPDAYDCGFASSAANCLYE